MLSFPIGAFPGYGSSYVPTSPDPTRRRVQVDLAQFGTYQTDDLENAVLTADLLVVKTSAATTGIAPQPTIGSEYVQVGRVKVLADEDGLAEFDLLPTDDMDIATGWELKYQFKWGTRTLKTTTLPASDYSSVSLTDL